MASRPASCVATLSRVLLDKVPLRPQVRSTDPSDATWMLEEAHLWWRSSHSVLVVHPCGMANLRRGTIDPVAAQTPTVDPSAGAFALSASFEDFFEMEHHDLFGALCLVTGNRHDAEELMQEAFMRVWERWDIVQGLQNPTGYLYRTAMNAFRMRHRRAKTAARRVMRTAWRNDDLEAFEARHELDRGLRQLTPRQRAAIVLTDLLGFSYDEASETLGVKAVTVRKLVSDGRRELRMALGSEHD